MSPIRNNPYRTLGLLANATEKELQKQLSGIKRYAEIGKQKTSDLDLPFLGSLTRDISAVGDAASKIEQPKNRIYYGLFWFLNANDIDEIALNHLKEGNPSKAREIWHKTTNSNDITQKNFSAAINLSTLILGHITANGSFDYPQFVQALHLKSKVLTPQAFQYYATAIAGDNALIDLDWVIENFIADITRLAKPHFKEKHAIQDIIAAFPLSHTTIQQHISKKFTSEPLASIETKIDQTREKRTEQPHAAGRLGENLFKVTKENLSFLKIIWPQNIQYERIVNKIAEEIVQCAIDFFNYYCESPEVDPSESAISLLQKAKSLNPTGQVKNRLEESIDSIQEWINDKSNREINSHINFIKKRLENYNKFKVNTLGYAEMLLVACKPELAAIRSALGAPDEFYIEISSAVVSNVQGILVEVINKAQENFYNTANNIDERLKSLLWLKKNPPSTLFRDENNKLKIRKIQNADKLHFDNWLDSMTAERKLKNNKGEQIEKFAGLTDEQKHQVLNSAPYALLIEILTEAKRITQQLLTFDMDQVLRQNCLRNKETLININDSIVSHAKERLLATTISTVKQPSGGCYIATMVYGDYNHPSVLKLRKFRDTTLVRFKIGRFFISNYYKYSPAFVQRYKDKPYINKTIRNFLSFFIRIIR